MNEGVFLFVFCKSCITPSFIESKVQMIKIQKHYIQNLHKSNVFDVRWCTIGHWWIADAKGSKIDHMTN